jgi:hypothetical protein
MLRTPPLLGCKTGPERDWTTVLCRWRDVQMGCGYAITSVNGEGVLKTKILYPLLPIGMGPICFFVLSPATDRYGPYLFLCFNFFWGPRFKYIENVHNMLEKHVKVGSPRSIKIYLDQRKKSRKHF